MTTNILCYLMPVNNVRSFICKDLNDNPELYIYIILHYFSADQNHNTQVPIMLF